MKKSLQVSENITFNEAIAFAEMLLSQIQAEEFSSEEILTTISALVKTVNGARGFFVTYLPSATNLADNPSPEIIKALQSSPDTIAELMVKNLVMSAAMVITHRRHKNEEMAQSSHRVKTRSANLIKLLQIPAIYEIANQILETITTGAGKYQEFLERWGYDTEQKQVMQETLQKILSNQ